MLANCGDNTAEQSLAPGPFDSLPLAHDLAGHGLTAPVHAARDTFGVLHLRAANAADLGFAQGYLTAHDRLAQMDLLRRYGAGTLAEMYGALDAKVIDTDLEMRLHKMTALATETWLQLQASSAPADQQLVAMLARFADGVNAYARDLVAGKWELDPEVEASFPPEKFAPWTPVDSLVLGRFQAFALSWTTPTELDLTTLYQNARATFDAANAPAAYAARRGVAADLLALTPIGKTAPIDGFPNVDTDTGTRADGGRPGRARRSVARPPQRAPAHAAARTSQTTRGLAPRLAPLPPHLLTAARSFFATDIHTGPFGALGPHAFMQPFAGSNNWAVAPALANGQTLLATDQHLNLANPSLFYPVALAIEGEFDAIGVTFPGIPGIILGANGNVAWSGTVSYHDVNDIYAETIAPCPTSVAANAACASWRGTQVPLTTRTEVFKIGAFGTVVEERAEIYEEVPHHGPIIPQIDRSTHRLVPRTGNQALAVRYTGHQPTFEIRAVWNLLHASSVDQAFAALQPFGFGSQNWTMIDNQNNIGWTTTAYVPTRPAAAMTWHPQQRPDGLAPFFVLPGDGTADWTGRLASRYVPHVINPASGLIYTANSDPVGATFDGDPLNQPTIDGADGAALYAGIAYAAGVRTERIANLLRAAQAQGPITPAALSAIQHDTHSTMGAKLQPVLTRLLSYLDAPSAAPADVAAYLGARTPTERTALQTAQQLLRAWSLETPTAEASDASETARTDSASTALFNTWMHFFATRILSDELAAINISLARLGDNRLGRIVYAALVEPARMVQAPATRQPVLCDALDTADLVESCDVQVLRALTEALAHLASPQGYGTTDWRQWRWGLKHRLTIAPLFPNAQLNLPRADEVPLPGFAKRGDTWVINRADHGWTDLHFAQYADGPAQRVVAVATPGQPIAIKWQIPGGTIFDSRSQHYRDQLDQYYLKEVHFDAPYTPTDVIKAGEDRWVLR